MMIHMARTPPTEVAMHIFPARALIRILSQLPLYNRDRLPRHDIVAAIRPAAELLTRIAVTHDMLQLFLSAELDLLLHVPTMTRALPPPSDTERLPWLRTKQHAVPDIDHDRVFDQRPCVAAELEVHGVLQEVVVEVLLRREFEHEAVRHAFAVRLPRGVLTHAHREHVGFAGGGEDAAGWERAEGVEVRLEIGPWYVRAVFEQDYVGYGS
jgi:hypothetical protein